MIHPLDPSVRASADVLGGIFHRVQFTPDLLPSDITGVSVFNQETHDFEFRPGAIFANVVVLGLRFPFSIREIIDGLAFA